jgi:hypothetical protein
MEQPTLYAGKYVCVCVCARARVRVRVCVRARARLSYLNFNLYFEPHKISGSEGREC